MRKILAATVLWLLSSLSVHASNAAVPLVTPQLIAADVLEAAPLGTNHVIYSVVDSEGVFAGFKLYNCKTGETLPWLHNWVPEHDGWDRPSRGLPLGLTTSSDGNWIAFASPVAVSDEVVLDNDVHRFAYVILISSADGTDIFPAAITVQVGGGPYIEFTYDGQLLVFSPALPCQPLAEDYAAYVNAGFTGASEEPFNCIDIPSHERRYEPTLELADGVERCPFSDYYRVETNDPGTIPLRSFNDASYRMTYHIPAGHGASYEGWVLPDALLITQGMQQLLLKADGSTRPVTTSGYHVVSWLGMETYLFSHPAGEGLQVGECDWLSPPAITRELLINVQNGWIEATAAPGASHFMLLVHGAGYASPSRLYSITLPGD